jgi:hypothetical protein
MYVMIDALECDYELALIENSLRDSVYFIHKNIFLNSGQDVLGVNNSIAGFWFSSLNHRLTRAQALYIATGNTTM